MTERWLPVVGFEDYEVSDQGRVRSVDRVVKNGRSGMRFRPGQILKFGLNRKGYRTVAPRKNGRNHTVAVHRFVARAFLGLRPVGLEICHNNGDSRDNRLENLRYDTRSANERDKVRHGTHNHASKTHCPHGHEYTPDNTRVDSRGGRRCITCARAESRASRLKRKQALAA